MQEAIPYRTAGGLGTASSADRGCVRWAGKDGLRKTVEENAVMVIGRSSCCMSHVARRLLQGLGANPAVYEVEQGHENAAAAELGVAEFPAVFIGGRWFGGLERVMASHITGELTPLLKQAGALWL